MFSVTRNKGYMAEWCSMKLYQMISIIRLLKSNNRIAEAHQLKQFILAPYLLTVNTQQISIKKL